MKAYLKLFNDYVKTFDYKDKMILDKFHHTYRVMDFCKQIALSIHADTKIAQLCGLFHDIGRFEQYQKYQTYFDVCSVDHGDLGVSILKEHFNSIENYDLILFATKNHNKLIIEETEDSKKLLFTKIVRDADKLDIMKEQGLIIKDLKATVNEEILSQLFSNQLVHDQTLKTDVDYVFRLLGFIYDINFKYTYQYILNNHIIENKINLLECYIEDERLEELKKHLIEYCMKKVNE
ncbi:HD domain-containing protein [bacterium]|nr:HD domain-containing protein [bacterium]